MIIQIIEVKAFTKAILRLEIKAIFRVSYFLNVPLKRTNLTPTDFQVIIFNLELLVILEKTHMDLNTWLGKKYIYHDQFSSGLLYDCSTRGNMYQEQWYKIGSISWIDDKRYANFRLVVEQFRGQASLWLNTKFNVLTKIKT